MNNKNNIDLNVLIQDITNQTAPIRRIWDAVSWQAQISSSLTALQNTLAVSDWYQQMPDITSSVRALQASFSVCQQPWNDTLTAVAEITSRINNALRTQILSIQPSIARLIQLQEWLSQLTEREFQSVQDSFEPSDELVEALDTTFEQAADLCEHDSLISKAFLWTKQYVKEHFGAILGTLISLYSIIAANPQLQTIMEQNEEIKNQNTQIIAQNEKEIELAQKNCELLERIADTIDLLINDSDMVRNALDTLSDQEQPVAVQPDQAVHSPVQNQTADHEQKNDD